MQFDEVETLIYRVARRFKTKSTDIENLAQTAWVIFLESMKNFDSVKGSEEVYIKSILIRQMKKTVLQETSPVSAPITASAKLKGHTVEYIENIADTYPDLKMDPLETLLQKECRSRIGPRLIEVAKNQSMNADIVLRILFSEGKPRQLAQERNVDITKLYKDVHRTRKALRADPQLKQIAREYL